MGLDGDLCTSIDEFNRACLRRVSDSEQCLCCLIEKHLSTGSDFVCESLLLILDLTGEGSTLFLLKCFIKRRTLPVSNSPSPADGCFLPINLLSLRRFFLGVNPMLKAKLSFVAGGCFPCDTIHVVSESKNNYGQIHADLNISK